MEYVNLGKTGKGFAICLGCMSYERAAGQPLRPAAILELNEEQSAPFSVRLMRASTSSIRERIRDRDSERVLGRCEG